MNTAQPRFNAKLQGLHSQYDNFSQWLSIFLSNVRGSHSKLNDVISPLYALHRAML
ncbi:hypothetical protein GAGA_4061 [Paraglaciecola agarilytica NO2]|uniref:Uncharacterized protein n=1 Tax=Paraglaciecola agarilytica NO2 TaxID=1125747 RepID=A0ABQ0IBZ9_9ALTE|nr:hypothetical protein GAGA_4061 [Paraglaciecola agarilytica NO2]